MKQIILMLLSFMMIITNFHIITVSAQDNGLSGNDLDSAIIEVIAYNQSTGLFVVEETKAYELGMSQYQVSNLSTFINSLDYEDTDRLISMTGGSREQLDNIIINDDSTSNVQPYAIITTSMVIGALKIIGTGAAMAIVRAITNYGMASACKNDGWRSQFKIFGDFCTANGW